jgi:glycosyltransferase involved in cell wall biosynthesis
MELSVVLPCYNEAENIEHTVSDVLSWFTNAGIDGEIIVVNDGSTDGSRERIDALEKQYANLIAIHHTENMGVGITQRDGCNRGTKKYLSYMDSDGQFKAEEFDLLIPKLSTHRIVAAYRIKRADPFIRSINAWLYGVLVRLVLGVQKRDVNCGLVVFERSLWPSIAPIHATGGLFPAEMYLRAKAQGIEVAEVGVQHYPRRAGEQTGARPQVIFRMFSEIRSLKKAIRQKGADPRVSE